MVENYWHKQVGWFDQLNSCAEKTKLKWVIPHGHHHHEQCSFTMFLWKAAIAPFPCGKLDDPHLLHQRFRVKPRYFEACLAGVSPASWTPLIRGIEVESTQLQHRPKQRCMWVTGFWSEHSLKNWWVSFSACHIGIILGSSRLLKYHWH